MEPTMTLDHWLATYRPIPNPTGDSGLSVEDDCLTFETFGDDLDRVLEADRANPETVWTLVDADGELIIVNGYSLVNRQGYFICEVPYQGEDAWIDYMDD